MSHSKVIIVCHKRWLGIRSSAAALGYPVALVDDNTFLHCSDFIVFFVKSGFKTLAIFGLPPYSLVCAKTLKAQLPGVKVVLSFHGSFTQHASQPSEARALQAVLDATRDGVIDRLGFLKNGMSFFFRALNISVVELRNVYLPLELQVGKLHELDGRYHIGLFTAGDSWIKNYHNQLAAACILPRAVIHTTVVPPESRGIFSMCSARVVEHGWLPHHVVPLFLGMTDINMYASLTESFPMVVLQSLAVGVPCVISNTSSVYSQSQFLSSKLIVDAHDDVHAIYRVLKNALVVLPSLTQEILRVLTNSNRYGMSAWKDFFDAPLPTVLAPPESLYISRGQKERSTLTSTQVLTICFITQELGLIMPGGMGTLLHGTLQALSADPRFRLVVVADVNAHKLLKWIKLVKDDGIELTVFRVAELVPKATYKLDEHTARALRFAEAVRSAYKRVPFDVVEGYDFFGPMAKLIQGGYVPNSVRMIVRLHGTLQMINNAQDVSLGGLRVKSRDYLTMTLLEQYALLAADALISNSEGSADVYRKLYPNLKEQFIATVPPPIQQILATAPRCTFLPSQSSIIYLVYGKQQEVKGTYTIVRAAVRFLQDQKVRKNNLSYRFRFVGHNALANCKQRRCLLSLIPVHLRSRFDFIESIPKSRLCNVLEGVRAAIFASLSETFCLAAHEIFAMGAPLIISDLAAVRPFFNSSNSIVFNPFDFESLVRALLRSSDDFLIDLRNKASKMQYFSIPSAYTALFEGMPPTQPHALFRAAETVDELLNKIPDE